MFHVSIFLCAAALDAEAVPLCIRADGTLLTLLLLPSLFPQLLQKPSDWPRFFFIKGIPVDLADPSGDNLDRHRRKRHQDKHQRNHSEFQSLQRAAAPDGSQPV